MKKASLLSLFILLLTMGGCSSDDPEETPKETVVPQIEITSSETIPTFPTSGGSTQFYFTTNVDWTAYVATVSNNAAGWCSVSPSSGTAGSGVLTITADPNDTYDERNTTFTIKAGTATKSFTVVQKQKDALLLTSDKVEVKADGGSIYVDVKANIDYEYKIDDAAKEWISKTNTRGLTQHKETFSVAANTSVTKREGKITFYSGEFSETVTVYQEAAEPTLVLTQNKYEVGADGETIKIELQSNVDYEMKLPSVDWISESKTRAMSSHTHYIIVKANDTYDERNAEITFVNKENNKSEKVTIVQKQKDAILVTSGKVEVGSDGGDITVEVQSNVTYEYKIDDAAKEWIAKVSTRGLATHKEVFRISANTTTAKREGKITFTNGTLSETVTVYQAGEGASLVLTQNKYEVASDGETIKIELQSNVDYEMQLPSVDWISESKTRTVSTHTRYVVVKPNETYDERSAEITFVNKEFNLSEKVTIVQKQKNALLVTSSNVEVGGSGGDITVEVQSNIDYEYKIDDAAKSWISKVSTRGLTSHKEVFRIAANTSLSKREGKITFSSGNLSETVTVTQGGEEPTITIAKNSYSVGADGETIIVEVQGNLDYDVKIPVDWIKETATRTIVSKSHRFTVAANTTTDERSAEILFVNTANNISRKVTVTQLGKNVLTIDKNSFSVSADGGNISVGVQCSGSYECEIESSAQSWISRTTTRSVSSSNANFRIAENTSTSSREGKITFKSGNLTATVTVTQEGEEPVITIDNSSYSVGADGGTIQVTVNSNVDYNVQIPVSWITEVKTRTVSAKSHSFTVAANSTSDERSAEITFVNTANNISRKVTVTQQGKNVLTIDKNSFSVSADGGNISVGVQCSGSYECEIESTAQPWISRTTTRSVSSSNANFRIAENTSTSSREGKITFKSGDLTATVTVTQEGEEPVITIDNSSYSVGADGGTIQVTVNSNVDYNVQIPVSWITEVKTRTVSAKSHSFTIAANSTSDGRSAEITFVNTANNISRKVTVTQDGDTSTNTGSSGVDDMPVHNW